MRRFALALAALAGIAALFAFGVTQTMAHNATATVTASDTPWGGDDTPWGGDDTPWGEDSTKLGVNDTPWGGDDTPWGGDDTPWGDE